MTAVARATCNGTTKTGVACRSRIVLEDGFCVNHSALSTVDPKATGRAGGLRSVEVRREQAKSVRDRLADRLQTDADEIYDTFRSAWLDGDWRAADAAISQALGRPPQAIIGDGDTPVAFQLVSAFQVDDRDRHELEAGA